MVLSDYLQIALICSALISRIHHGVSSRGGVEVGERGFLERGGAQESIVSKHAGAGQFGFFFGKTLNGHIAVEYFLIRYCRLRPISKLVGEAAEEVGVGGKPASLIEDLEASR